MAKQSAHTLAVSRYVEALRHLIGVLTVLGESGELSDGDYDCDWIDEFLTRDSGTAVVAVKAVEAARSQLTPPGRGLPMEIRPTWRQLLKCRRIEASADELENIKAETCTRMIQWAEGEIARLQGGGRGMFADLAAYARDTLKGIEKRIIELLIEHDGSLSLSNLASDPDIGWLQPCDSPFSSAQGRLNRKLEKAGLPYRLGRHDNEARITRAQSDVETT